jgi:hypothetical protein
MPSAARNVLLSNQTARFLTVVPGQTSTSFPRIGGTASV